MSRVLAPGCLKAQAVIIELLPALLKPRGVYTMVRRWYHCKEETDLKHSSFATAFSLREDVGETA